MVVGLIGAGNMARALALGWGDPVLCSDGGSGRAHQLAQELGGQAFQSNLEVGLVAQHHEVCRGIAALERDGVRTAFQSAIDAVIDGGSR